MQRIVEINALANGAHRNQSYPGFVPDGWALIPTDMDTPNFPFGEVEVEEVTHYRDVEVVREVTKTREVPQTDDEGNTVMVTEEYTEEELVTEQEPYMVMTVTKWTPGELPEPQPEPEPQPTLGDRVTTLETSSAEMAEALDLLLSGVTE